VKALISGGAGFIGIHLTNELLKNNFEVTLIDNFSRGVKDSLLNNLEENENINLVKIDLLNKHDVLALGQDYDYIFHLAAIIGVQNVLNRPYDVLHQNVNLLFNMIDIAKKQNELRRFVFASTSEVYAGALKYFDMKIPTPEDTPLTVTELDRPRTSYMLSKIYGEAVMNQSSIPFTIIRPHNFYGPRMGMSHIIPELLRKVYFNEGNGRLEVFSVNHKRTFCYIEDAVNIIRLLAESDECCNKTFNVGNQELEVSMQQVAEIVLKTVGREYKIDAKPATAGSPERRCPDMSKVYKSIGYKCRISLEEGIQKTYDWYKENIFDGNEACAK